MLVEIDAVRAREALADGEGYGGTGDDHAGLAHLGRETADHPTFDTSISAGWTFVRFTGRSDVPRSIMSARCRWKVCFVVS
jgi:hypothetical protein